MFHAAVKDGVRTFDSCSFFFNFSILFMCMSPHVDVHVCTGAMEAEEGIGSPGVQVICELPERSGSSARAGCVLSC